MNLLRVRAVARKEWLHIVRDPFSLGMAIVIPLLLLVLFGSALTLDVDRVPLAVWDQDGTDASRGLVSRFEGSRYFAVRERVRTYRELEEAIDRGRVLAGLVIPTSFAGWVEAGRGAPVQLIVDGSDANTATLATGYARALVSQFSEHLAVEAAMRSRGRVPAPVLDVRPRVWFNSGLESRNAIVPGLIVVILMVIAALLTSLTVAREWERGTMEQLIATPVRVPELILGKLLPYFGIGLVDTALSVLMGQFLFQVPLRGSVALLFGLASVFLAGALAFGMLISILARSQLVATQFAVVTTFLPTFLLSGFVFAIGNMPTPIQVFTHVIPARYFVSILKGIYLKGVGLEILAGEAALLAAFGLLVLAASNLAFRKKVAP